MAQERFANNPSSTLTSAISSSDTTLTVDDASSFPSVAQFRLLIGSEILLVTGVSTNTFTVSRGQEGTTAASHVINSLVEGIFTKESHLNSHVIDVRNYGALGDGSTDDSTAIQDAIDAAPAGATLRLHPLGNYVVGTALTISSSLHIEGNGATMTAGADGLDKWLTVDGVDGFSVRNVRFDDDDRGRRIISIEGTGSKNFFVEDCYFTGYSDDDGTSTTESAVLITDATDGKVRGCTFDTFGNGSTSLPCGIGINNSVVQRVVITENIFNNMSQGVRVNGTDGLVIANNLFDTLSDNAIYVLPPVRALQISGNQFQSCEETIVLHGSTVASTWLSNVTIIGNNFIGSTNKDIAYDGHVEGVTIANNIMRDCGSVIARRVTDDDQIRGWSITGNTIITTTSFAALYFRDMTDVAITGNVFRVDGDTASWCVIRQDTGDVSGVLVADNVFDDASSAIVGSNQFNGTVTSTVVSNNIMVGTLQFKANDSILFRNQVWSNTTNWRGVDFARKFFFGTAAPTTGTWTKGDIMFASGPSAGGTIGWVCTAAGTPGTWKTFGTIAS